jgi:hypothetical protein
MSKLMFAFLMACSIAMYNPAGIRDFAKYQAPELAWQIKNGLYSVDRMLPSFMRFTKG